jgi:serine phosphatase RsbU (regulator of sigma subunit)
MDISLCFFEKNRHEQKILFRFAGAKTSVYYLSENKIFEVKGNRQYIGGQKRNEKPFDNHELLLPLPTQFYLFTDGLIDQNNPENLKLGSVKFKEFIAEICLTDFLEQKEKILTLFRQFRAGEEQRDDVSVLSVRFENF